MGTVHVGILKILGIGAAIPVLLVAASLGWFVIQAKQHNSAALANAQEVCSTVPIGERPKSLQTIAEQKGGFYFSNSAEAHTVAFAGYVYDHAECRVTVHNGVVTSKDVVMVHE